MEWVVLVALVLLVAAATSAGMSQDRGRVSRYLDREQERRDMRLDRRGS